PEPVVLKKAVAATTPSTARSGPLARTALMSSQSRRRCPGGRASTAVISLPRRQLQVEVGVLAAVLGRAEVVYLHGSAVGRARAARVAGEILVLGHVGHVEVARVGVARVAGIDRLAARLLGAAVRAAARAAVQGRIPGRSAAGAGLHARGVDGAELLMAARRVVDGEA